MDCGPEKATFGAWVLLDSNEKSRVEVDHEIMGDIFDAIP